MISSKRRPAIEKQVAIYLIRRYMDLTKGEIGKIFKMKAQAVSKVGIKIERLMERERKIRSQVKNLNVEDKAMKKIILTLLLLLIIPVLLLADDIIYDKPYGGKKVGRIDEKGYIYDKPYGGKKIGRVKDGFVYDSPYGGKKVGRIEDSGKLYNQPYGGKAVGRYKDGKVYNEPYGGKAIGKTEDKNGAGYWLLKEKLRDKEKP